MIPPEEFAQSRTHFASRSRRAAFSVTSTVSLNSSPGSPRGRFGSEPLHLKPGKYPVFAQVGDLKSGVEDVEIIPAARLQIRKSSRPTDRSREYAAEDPSDAILAWQTGKGEKQEALINWDGGIFIDETRFGFRGNHASRRSDRSIFHCSQAETRVGQLAFTPHSHVIRCGMIPTWLPSCSTKSRWVPSASPHPFARIR